MSQTQQPFEDFHFSTRNFRVTGSRLQIIRTWQRLPRLGQDETRELSAAICGVAVGDDNEVRVIGTAERATEFSLTIRAECDAKRSWDDIKALNLLADGDRHSDTPERRVRNEQYELLNKAPPTATLFVTYADKDLGTQGGWSIECEIPQQIFEHLVSDLSEHRANEVTIDIGWVAGLARNNLFPSMSTATTWGLFKLSERDYSPEPLQGHVSLIRWDISTEIRKPFQFRVKEVLEDAREDWAKSFDKLCDERREPGTVRFSPVLRELAMSITKWCDKEGESVNQLQWRLVSAYEFMQRLDQALHQKNGPFDIEKTSVWQHRQLGKILRETKPSQRENFVEMGDLGPLATEYITNSYLHHPYLDWLFLDAMTSGAIIVGLEPYMRERHGMAYDLFEGVRWKMLIWKLVVWPLSFVVGWALPALVWYLLNRWSMPFALAIGAIWYGFNFFMLARWLWFKISHLISGKPTSVQRMADLTEEAELVYALLAGPVLHVREMRSAFERAAARGVKWDARIFYILDRLAQRPPQIWENQLR